MIRISAYDTAKILNVSVATVRNWAKAGYLPAIATRPLAFYRADVLALHETIKTNTFSRLRKRANKTASEVVPINQMVDPRIAGDIAAYSANLKNTAGATGIDTDKTVFWAALFHLRQQAEVDFDPKVLFQSNRPEHSPESLFAGMHWQRSTVRNVLLNWYLRLPGTVPPPDPSFTEAFLSWKKIEDPLGILYQGLSMAGARANTGAFFTPDAMIDTCLDDFAEGEKDLNLFLDPCCGTGRYLVKAAKRFALQAEQVYGFDNDPTSVDIARVNLLLAFPEREFQPKVECLDSLQNLANGHADCRTNDLLERFDAVATNPPWGGKANFTLGPVGAGENFAGSHPDLFTGSLHGNESFSLFLEKSLQLLRPGGRLSFLLPESILKVRAHAEIRRVLLEKTCIRKIVLLGRVFPSVFTPIIRLDLEKRLPEKNWRVTVCGKGCQHETLQARFQKNMHLSFDVMVTPDDSVLLDKIYSVPHQTLVGKAEWALGIVTGDNARRVLNAPAAGSEPVLRGRDIFKYRCGEPKCHIVFNPKTFQQVAPERIYRAPEKLIYRFVSDRLVFAYDNLGLLTLNSANIVIPNLPGLSTLAALAFFNSSLFQYVFAKRCQNRKILRGDLEMLPFPNLFEDAALKLEKQALRCLECGMGLDNEMEKLDHMIYSVFGMNEKEVAHIEKSLAEGEGMV